MRNSQLESNHLKKPVYRSKRKKKETICKIDNKYKEQQEDEHEDVKKKKKKKRHQNHKMWEVRKSRVFYFKYVFKLI